MLVGLLPAVPILNLFELWDHFGRVKLSSEGTNV